MVNSTFINSSMNYQEVIQASHIFSAIPAVLILYFSSIIILILSGLMILDKQKTNMMKFAGIVVMYSVLAGIVVTWICYSPNSIQAISNFVMSIFT